MTKDVFSIKNPSSTVRKPRKILADKKNPSKFELEDIEVNEIRDNKKPYKKMIITKAHQICIRSWNHELNVDSIL